MCFGEGLMVDRLSKISGLPFIQSLQSLHTLLINTLVEVFNESYRGSVTGV